MEVRHRMSTRPNTFFASIIEASIDSRIEASIGPRHMEASRRGVEVSKKRASKNRGMEASKRGVEASKRRASKLLRRIEEVKSIKASIVLSKRALSNKRVIRALTQEPPPKWNKNETEFVKNKIMCSSRWFPTWSIKEYNQRPPSVVVA